MTIHIPIMMLWFLIGAILWFIVGSMVDFIIIVVEPGIALGVSSEDRLCWRCAGPLLLVVLVQIIWARYKQKH